MVCSKHFVDGIPTIENPYPSLEMGYEKPTANTKRKLLRMDVAADPIDSDSGGWDELESIDDSFLNYHNDTLIGDPCNVFRDKIVLLLR